MARFVQGSDRYQVALLQDCLDDNVCADNPVRVVDVFVDELDLAGFGFTGVMPVATGWVWAMELVADASAFGSCPPTSSTDVRSGS